MASPSLFLFLYHLLFLPPSPAIASYNGAFTHLYTHRRFHARNSGPQRVYHRPYIFTILRAFGHGLTCVPVRYLYSTCTVYIHTYTYTHRTVGTVRRASDARLVRFRWWNVACRMQGRIEGGISCITHACTGKVFSRHIPISSSRVNTRYRLCARFSSTV